MHSIGFWAPVILLAVAASLDNCAAGIAYGIRRIRVPATSNLLMAFLSALATWLTVAAGGYLGTAISLQLARLLGALLMIGIGLWVIFEWPGEAARQEPPLEKAQTKPGRSPDFSGYNYLIMSWRLKPLGIIIQILREPSKADLDLSGTISLPEAFLLGTALALNALAGGLGAGLAGFPPLFTAVMVGALSYLLLWFGVYLGSRFGARWLGEKAPLFTGLALILLGITSFKW
ncbi:MAG: sporulation membrane protein YtaF [Firmicutes bacterium]|nr:sporulation membrane protein YtaF [Bacillota bacterium]